MKHTHLFAVLVFALLFLTACAPHFPQVDAYYISPFELTDKEKRLRKSLAISPDGNTILVGNNYLVGLESGEKEDLHLYGKIEMDSHDILDDSGFWSFDGHYLGVPAKHYEGGRDPVGSATYIFDLRDNTFRRYDTWSSAFSPFNSNQILTSEGVYNLDDGTIAPFLPDYDFSQEKEFGATGYPINFFLWGKNSGVPVGQISNLPHNAKEKDDIEVVIQSFDWYPSVPSTEIAYTALTGFVSKRPNQLSGLFFDPTGEYILISEWQCHENQTPCTITPFNTDSVYDTVLTLVRWRTQEQQELIRLSEIDPENVVAYGYMAWSADGSTIFISRKDALPIVLKVK